MPLQNRVTPFGDIVALPGRGLFTGNRGILHDDHRRIVRPWQGKRWIACVTEFRGIRRVLMRPHTWTELFFLDEATALAAGHRPCAECRRAEYRRFQSCWRSCFGGDARADDMDAVLHEHRLERRRKRTHRRRLDGLPDGVFVALDDAAWLVLGPALLRWSVAGYTERRQRRHFDDVEVLTPKPMIDVIAAGYAPVLHRTAAP